MTRLFACLLVTIFLVHPRVSVGDGPDGPRPLIPTAGLPTGKWVVEFANGVVEQCEIRADETVSVVEPRRASTGKVSIKAASFVIVCEDDRVERWTPVGKRFVVEHWASGSQILTGMPVLGIAELGQ